MRQLIASQFAFLLACFCLQVAQDALGKASGLQSDWSCDLKKILHAGVEHLPTSALETFLSLDNRCIHCTPHLLLCSRWTCSRTLLCHINKFITQSSLMSHWQAMHMILVDQPGRSQPLLRSLELPVRKPLILLQNSMTTYLKDCLQRTLGMGFIEICSFS